MGDAEETIRRRQQDARAAEAAARAQQAQSDAEAEADVKSALRREVPRALARLARSNYDQGHLLELTELVEREERHRLFGRKTIHTRENREIAGWAVAHYVFKIASGMPKDSSVQVKTMTVYLLSDGTLGVTSSYDRNMVERLTEVSLRGLKRAMGNIVGDPPSPTSFGKIVAGVQGLGDPT